MIWLLPAAGCSIAIAIILKINEVWKGDRVLLAGANYLVASLLSLILVGARITNPGASVLIIGGLAGIDFVLGFLLLMAGIARGPLAIPVTVMRLSVAVPIAASIFVWSEHPGAAQWLGIVLGIVAIIMFGFGVAEGKSGKGSNTAFWMLIVSLFLVMGVGDTLLKAFRELSPQTDRLLFTLILFTVAAVFTWLLIWIRRISFNGKTFVLGLVLGVPNLFSTVFILMALQKVPASIAFPFVNLTVILGSTVLGFAIWKERIGPLSFWGIIVAAAALILLPMG